MKPLAPQRNRRLDQRCPPGLAVVHWYFKDGHYRGHGQPLPEPLAASTVDWANEKHPDLIHYYVMEPK